MVFAFNEISNYGGRPVYLFEFERSPVVWRYCAADRDITLDGNVYTAKPISCGPIRQTGDAQADEFTITAPTSIDFIEQFVLLPPSERTDVTVIKHHIGDSDSVVWWKGFVDRVRREDRANTAIVCRGLTGTLRRAGVRLPWQRQCPHALFDSSCKVSKAAHAVSATVSSVSGITVVAPGLAAIASGRLAGGFVEWTTDVGFKARKAILEHSGTAISLLGGVVGIDVGTVIMAYPGCPRNAESCQSLYNNLANFGGFRHLPSKSPFDGNPVF